MLYDQVISRHQSSMEHFQYRFTKVSFIRSQLLHPFSRELTTNHKIIAWKVTTIGIYHIQNSLEDRAIQLFKIWHICISMRPTMDYQLETLKATLRIRKETKCFTWKKKISPIQHVELRIKSCWNNWEPNNNIADYPEVPNLKGKKAAKTKQKQLNTPCSGSNYCLMHLHTIITFAPESWKKWGMNV